MKTQYIKIAENGKYYYSDAAMTILHREDGPAVECDGVYKSWWIDGKLHRTDGPAIEWVNGSKAWWINGNRHRIDGPAIEYADGTKLWWINDRLHRIDGPAVEWADGHKSWYVDSKYLTEEQFNARFAPMELTLDQIAAKFNINVNNLKIVK